MAINGSDKFDLFNISALMNDIAFISTSTKTQFEEFTSVKNTSIVPMNSSNAYEWRLILPTYFLIFLLSIIGNGLVIATLINNRRMRTVTNVYLINLAISDLLLGVFCLPFTLIGQLFRRFLFGSLMCKLIPFLQAVSVSVDVWTLVAISLERYFAICRPLKSRRWQTQCHAYKMIATVWMMSLVLNSPILYVSTLQPMKNDAYKCREVWPTSEMEQAFNLGLDAVLLLIPLLMMLLAYCLIVKKLWRRMRHEIQQNFNWQRGTSKQASCKSCRLLIQATPSVQQSSPELYCKKENWSSKNRIKDKIVKSETEVTSNQSECIHNSFEKDFRHAVRSTHIDKSIEAKSKVIRMLFVIILEFFICWTPLHVINTMYVFYPEELYEFIGSKGIMSLQLLAFCSSCCNPITYCFMNRKFRMAFINSLRNCSLFRKCFADGTESQKQATPQPSSQDMTACIIRGSQTARTDLEGLEGEECV